jgi:hypothetical protein
MVGVSTFLLMENDTMLWGRFLKRGHVLYIEHYVDAKQTSTRQPVRMVMHMAQKVLMLLPDLEAAGALTTLE